MQTDPQADGAEFSGGGLDAPGEIDLRLFGLQIDIPKGHDSLYRLL